MTNAPKGASLDRDIGSEALLFNYQPVVHAKAGQYFGAALVGTHSAVMGWNVTDPDLRKGLRGATWAPRLC